MIVYDMSKKIEVWRQNGQSRPGQRAYNSRQERNYFENFEDIASLRQNVYNALNWWPVDLFLPERLSHLAGPSNGHPQQLQEVTSLNGGIPEHYNNRNSSNNSNINNNNNINNTTTTNNASTYRQSNGNSLHHVGRNEPIRYQNGGTRRVNGDVIHMNGGAQPLKGAMRGTNGPVAVNGHSTKRVNANNAGQPPPVRSIDPADVDTSLSSLDSSMSVD